MTTLSATTMTLGERFAYAGRMALIGMLTIFVALSVLWGALALFRLALAAFERRKAGKLQAAAACTEPTAAPVPTAAPDEGAVIAAITAAISEVLAAENGGKAPSFRVVSYRRTRS
ncbi:MAG: OadG family protein [Clostridia bacterium]|nr:OadG family protein [Clostridia bacterium]